MPPTRTDYLKVVFVLTGWGDAESPKLKTVAAIEEGDLVLVPPRIQHAFHDDPASQAAYIVLCVRRSVLRICDEDSDGSNGPPCCVTMH